LIQLLGHTVCRLGVSPTLTYVAKVANYQNVTLVKDVQAWLERSGFYRGYLRHYAQRSAAARECLEVCCLDRNRTHLCDAWTAECEAERLDICRSLQCTNSGPLAHPNLDRPCRFECDGSVVPGGVGGCLAQIKDDGNIRPVGNASRA
jgi:hypothetical protein